MPQGVLNVVAEDPQEEHVPQDVKPAGMHEHRREGTEGDAGPHLRRGEATRPQQELGAAGRGEEVGDVARNDPPVAEKAVAVELAAQSELVDKDEQVEGDDRQVDVGYGAGTNAIADRYHCLYPVSRKG